MTEAWSRGRLELVAVCPACGVASSVAAEYRRGDDASVMPDTWRMVRCAACRSLYLDPRPDPESLPRAYADYYTHQAEWDEFSTGRARGPVARLVNGYLNRRFDMCRKPASSLGVVLFKLLLPLGMKLDVYGRHVPKRMCVPGTRLLDVGCGNGAFLVRAREMGITVRGCEPDARAVDVCRNSGLDVLRGDVFNPAFDTERFDITTLNHVIEHVYDPQRVLLRLHELLAPDGVIWMALPNPGALGLRLFKTGWSGLHPPFHLILPQQGILRRWLREAGFTNIKLVKRGAQSPGLWQESIDIARREGTAPAHAVVWLVRVVGDVLSTFSTRWSEETILVAQKGAQV